jgi:hypothetical protein
VKKALKWFSLLVLALVGLPLAAVIAINVVDETLDPKAAALGEPRATVVPEAENGYLALLAMGAADGADGMAYARQWLAEARAAAKENRAEKRDEVKRAKRPEICDAFQKPCLAAVQDTAADLAGKLDAYKEDLARYEKLIAARAYEEVLDYPLRLDGHLPSYAPVMAAQRAYLVRAALLVQAGKIDEALSEMGRDLAFQRVMLGGARTLIGKMVATANTMRDLAFIVDLLQTRAADIKPHAPRLAQMLKPIAPEALRLDAALETEFGFIKQQMKNPAAASVTGVAPQWIERIVFELFHKTNASINQLYARHVQRLALLRKPAAMLLVEKEAPTQGFELSRILDYVYNPVGKLLLEVGEPSFVLYALRLHDLDAYNRLAGLGVELIAGDAGTDGIADAVAKSDARFHDPYTGKPMAWDAGTRQLSFKASKALVNRKPFNLENGRVVLRL